MTARQTSPSPRQTELLEAAYRYALAHGLTELSLRPLAAAIGSSPRVLLYLFGSKDGLVRALLARARIDEFDVLSRVQPPGQDSPAGLEIVAERIWSWLSAPEHRSVLILWVDSYARSLTESEGPWAGFAQATVTDWLAVLTTAQPPAERDSPWGQARRSNILAVLRGAMLDLLATGDRERTTAAVHHHLAAFRLAAGADSHGKSASMS